MWFESQNCAMMGLQATTGKRKLEAATTPGESSPAKNGRWEAEDCIARLQAVAVPSDAWKTATLLSEDFEDDEDFDDDLSDDDRCGNGSSGGGDRSAAGIPPESARFAPHPQQPPPPTPYPPSPPPNNNNNHIHNSNNNNNNNNNSARYQSADYWQYYQPPQQQTIRCEENGKSYLELGAAPPVRAVRCCDGRTRWCHVPCYRQRRLAVLNLSMCKLARYRQCSDPSLRRSVLICNTLRRLEREMESEPPEPPSGVGGGGYAAVVVTAAASATSLPELSPPSRVNPVVPDSTSTALYENSLREMTSSSGRATPFPSSTTVADTDSGIGDDETTRPINWGSVLSLTSQTDLESLNNNELYAELGLTTGDFEWSNKEAPRQENEWDGFMHVLVGGS